MLNVRHHGTVRRRSSIAHRVLFLSAAAAAAVCGARGYAADAEL